MREFEVGFIGVGNMASAIINGVLDSALVPAKAVALYDVRPEATLSFAKQGAVVSDSIAQLVKESEIVVLAVKPQQFSDILPEVKKGMQPDTLLVSIAAGVSAQDIKEAIGFDCKIVLAMPNTPLLVGAGATVLARVEPTNQDEFSLVRELFSSAGQVEEVAPRQMNNTIPIHSSSPAYLFELARIVSEQAQQVGVPRDVALRLFSQTLIGAGTMLQQSGHSPEELISMVCSPGGTTLAGMRALEQAGFEQAVENAFSATIWRGKELSHYTPQCSGVKVVEVEYDSDAYQQALALRYEVMRKPLGLEILDSDRETDKQATHLCALAEDGQVVGTCQLVEQDVFTVRLGQVAVAPDQQGEGIGSLLLYVADQLCKERGYSNIVVESRMAAKNFYLRQGYLTRGSEFLKHGIDHIAMYKDLD